MPSLSAVGISRRQAAEDVKFWKHVIGTRTDAIRDGRTISHDRHRRVSRTLVLTSAAVAFAAIAFGAPVVGISVFLLTTLPFVLSGT